MTPEFMGPYVTVRFTDFERRSEALAILRHATIGWALIMPGTVYPGAVVIQGMFQEMPYIELQQYNVATDRMQYAVRVEMAAVAE